MSPSKEHSSAHGRQAPVGHRGGTSLRTAFKIGWFPNVRRDGESHPPRIKAKIVQLRAQLNPDAEHPPVHTQWLARFKRRYRFVTIRVQRMHVLSVEEKILRSQAFFNFV